MLILLVILIRFIANIYKTIFVIMSENVLISVHLHPQTYVLILEASIINRDAEIVVRL